jgi:2-keto-4-pentenoate hydratase/2-oxohepta-3-ene-1,7-dioic acid hydratase in catechol pathway
MKIARFEHKGRQDYGFVLGESLVPASSVVGDLPQDAFELVSSEVLMEGSFLRSLSDLVSSTAARIPIGLARLLAPIPRPGKIICLGRNYMEHAAEADTKPPKDLMIFLKPATAVAGPFDDIVYPALTRQLDYEGELGVVMGKRCKRVSPSEAMGFVLGFLVFDDVSARDIQFGDGQWSRGKSCDTFAPIGPWITTEEEVGDSSSLSLKTWVNGDLRQNASTAGMTKKVPEIISTLSQGMTLEAGDIIATGTPAGVGIHWKPEPRLLKPGDVVKIEIEGLGCIENRVVAEA